MEFYEKIRKFLLNIFHKEINFPSVTGKERRIKGRITRPSIVYADEYFKINKELKKLSHPDLRSAEVNASNKGDMYLYSYIAPPRYGVRSVYGGIINFISFFLGPFRLGIAIVKYVYDLLLEGVAISIRLAGKILPVAIGIVVILGIIGAVFGKS